MTEILSFLFHQCRDHDSSKIAEKVLFLDLSRHSKIMFLYNASLILPLLSEWKPFSLCKSIRLKTFALKIFPPKSW